MEDWSVKQLVNFIMNSLQDCNLLQPSLMTALNVLSDKK